MFTDKPTTGKQHDEFVLYLGKVNNNNWRGTNWRRTETGEGRIQCIFDIFLRVYIFSILFGVSSYVNSNLSRYHVSSSESNSEWTENTHVTRHTPKWHENAKSTNRKKQRWHACGSAPKPTRTKGEALNNIQIRPGGFRTWLKMFRACAKPKQSKWDIVN